MTSISDEEARGRLVTLEKLVHQFETYIAVREEHLVN